MFVYTTGQGVHGFTYDPSVGEFLLSHEDIRMPTRGKIYSVNEGYTTGWSEPVQQFVQLLKSENADLKGPYTSRYVGSLVADFDRTLRKGGIFLYPPDKKSQKGKLRLLYECVPLAFIAEQAGGRAVHVAGDVLDIQPTNIHERSPFIAGSRTEVDLFVKRCCKS